MTTTAKGPRKAPAHPTRLELAVRLLGFTFKPETLKGDGTRKSEPEVTLEVVHEGDGAEDLFAFLTHARGDLRIALTPADDTGLDGWKGDGTLGTLRFERRDGVVVRFAIRVAHHKVQILEDLVGVRLAMSRVEESAAVLELEAVEPDLDFEAGDPDGSGGA